MSPIITIFCPFTRRWAVDKWLGYLADVDHDPTLTNLCFIIDLEELYIRNQLKKFAEERGYRSFHVKMNEGHYPTETSIKKRRQRIADIHEQAKDLVAKCDGDIIIGLEDDTVFDRLGSFERLLSPFANDNIARVGMVQGVQMGRWGTRMIGAWRVDDPLDPQHIETLLPPERGSYEEISGGGWYGYATPKHLFLNAPYFDSPSHPWGPDVEFGLWLGRQGYRCLVDWDTMFGHDDYGTIMYPDDPKANLTQVMYDKNKITGRWDRKDHERNR